MAGQTSFMRDEPGDRLGHHASVYILSISLKS